VEEGDIQLGYVCSEEQLTDILTKTLPKARFEELQAKIVCVSLEHKLGGSIVS
jgi:hypothetical protein